MKIKIFLLFALSLLLSACGSSSDENPQNKEPEIKQLALVDIAEAKQGDLYHGISFTGNLAPLNSVAISTEVSGTAKDVLVREGETVKKGQLLAVLDNESLRQSVTEQEAQLANTNSRLKLAQIKLYQQKELFKQGFISKLAYDEAISEFAISQGNHDAQVTQLATARKSFSDTKITAPISGVLFQKKISPGETVNQHTQIFAVADLKILEIAATIPSQNVSLISINQTVKFKVDGYSQIFTGKVSRINPVANENTRTFTVYIEVDNSDGTLKAGQFTQGDIVLQAASNVVLLPLNAVQKDAKNQTFVMAIEQNKVKQTPVSVILQNETTRQIAIKGISVNTKVLAAPILGIKSGDTIKLPQNSKGQ